VYEAKEENAKEEKVEEGEDGQGGTADVKQQIMSVTLSAKTSKEKWNKGLEHGAHSTGPRKDIRGLLEGFNDNMDANEKNATSSQTLSTRAKPSGKQVKGTFSNWCCSMIFCAQETCMFAWCTNCHEKNR
jgi:hypothetical protein